MPTITDFDPLRFDLLFERFLNPERVSMPDFDVDFCQRNRYKTLQHVVDHYGRNAVSQIAAFGTLAPKAAIQGRRRARALVDREGAAVGLAVVEKCMRRTPDSFL